MNDAGTVLDYIKTHTTDPRFIRFLREHMMHQKIYGNTERIYENPRPIYDNVTVALRMLSAENPEVYQEVMNAISKESKLHSKAVPYLRQALQMVEVLGIGLSDEYGKALMAVGIILLYLLKDYQES